ncbi:hypothetical protein BDU57DRAFT_509716 [Ampelomyces quisqualis]|uniref:Uncharacterized protein n=1 Tax=Ampelomyces quisqualis TaxID=50730 RepID=A0A6A5R075_AMPQU|nr:hypothetical protein BDU57DRAFT_509716 [Ampelomyces quisqualis]
MRQAVRNPLAGPEYRDVCDWSHATPYWGKRAAWQGPRSPEHRSTKWCGRSAVNISSLICLLCAFFYPLRRAALFLQHISCSPSFTHLALV